MMKKNILSLCALLALSSPDCWAQQRQKGSEDFTKEIELDHYGKLNYYYLVDKEGDVIYDGPVTINAKRNVKNFRPDPFSSPITFSGTYTLRTSCKKGYLHGPLTLTARQFVSSGGKSSTKISTFTGNYVNGVPHGQFRVNNRVAPFYKMNARFKNGKLVGPYFFDGYCSESHMSYTIKGTLTEKGVPTGAWKRNGSSYVFQNGVLVSYTDGREAMKPALSALSKKFAAGQITEEELLKNNYVVDSAYISLDDPTTTALISDLIDFDKLAQHYDFSANKNVPYRQIQEISLFNEAGYDFLEDEILESTSHGNDLDALRAVENAKYWKCIGYEPSFKLYYVEPYSLLFEKGYTTSEKQYEGRVYFKESEMERLKQSVHNALLRTATTALKFVEKEENVRMVSNPDSLPSMEIERLLRACKNGKETISRGMSKVEGNDKYAYLNYGDYDARHTIYLEKASVKALDEAILKLDMAYQKKLAIEKYQQAEQEKKDKKKKKSWFW